MRLSLLTAIAFVVLLAGCTGGGGPATEPTGSEAVTDPTGATADATPTHESALKDEHPYVEDGQVNASAMLAAHIRAIERAKSLTTINNISNEDVESGTITGGQVLINRANIADQRWHLTTQAFGENWKLDFVTTRYANSSKSCYIEPGNERCRTEGFDRNRALRLTVQDTILETIQGPSFRPAGIVTRDDQSLYRYTADSFRDPLPKSADKVLTPDPVLKNATVLVAQNGRIVEYSISYTWDFDGARQLSDDTYRTRDFNSTTVTPPAELR